MELQAISGQLYIVNGEVVERPRIPGLLSQRPPRDAARGRQQDTLFVHLTLSGSPEDYHELAEYFLGQIQSVFYQTAGSVTAALRKAIIDANNKLLAYNLNKNNPAREGAVTCAVQRGNEMYTAQAGETFAILGHNIGIERIPPGEIKSSQPLGRSAGLDLRLFHHWLQPGDVLLLADPRLAHISSERWEKVLLEADAESGTNEIEAVVGSDSGRVMIVEFADNVAVSVPEEYLPRRRQSFTSSLPAPTGAPVREESRHPNNAVHAAKKHTFVPDVEKFEDSARQATSRTVRGLSKLAGWSADVMARMRAPRDTEQQAKWSVPVFLAVAIPAIVSIIVVSVYLQRGQALRVSELRLQMRQELTLAEEARNDPNAAAQYFHAALLLGQEGELIRPGDPEIAALEATARAGLDELQGVGRLGTRHLYHFDDSSHLAALVLGGGENIELFVLDGGNNVFYRILFDNGDFDALAAEPELILFGDQAVGSHVVGTLTDALWRPQGLDVSREGVAVLDASGALITYYANFGDVRSAPLGLSSEWITPGSMATYNERLYILDRQAKSIWRYLPDGDGFITDESQRAIVFAAEPELDKVVDFVIHSEDGSVILLYEDGRVRRYVNGRLMWDESDVARNGLETPLTAPATIKLTGNGLVSSLYILDPGTGRVVELGLGGNFLSQYKASDLAGGELFSSAKDIALNEQPFSILTITENDLYVVTPR